VHGLLALDTLDLAPRPFPPGVEIRRAEPTDRGHLEELSDVTWRHQVRAPVWGIHLPERQARHRREYGDLCEDAEATVWLAFCDGRVVGVQVYFPAEATDDNPLLPIIPEHCAELGVAGTREWARGRGIGQALTRHGLAHARDAGFRFCMTDWRSTNLLSSRFWPRRGFRPVAYRLARRIDPRIAWAGERPG
jgi:GNAT superfamily N-acetyltransferase